MNFQQSSRELIIDSFAGGGGASTGIEIALGRSPDIAINHDAEALALHAANHPHTRHLSKNIWKVDPIDVVGTQAVGLLWASPDCKHFSKAKGGKPVKRNIRDLAWVVVTWARRARPRIIILENVEEFQHWGPVCMDGSPFKDRKGETFRKWLGELRALGYRVEWRELRGCDYGAPTIRKRLFLIARCDGEKIVWPKATHAPTDSRDVLLGKKKPYRVAADIIDWSIPCPSIFLTKDEGRALGVKRPLVEATMARIAKGVRRYILESAKPFIVPVTHQGDSRVHSVDEPLRTVTTAQRGEYAVISPTLVQTGYGERKGQSPRALRLDKPLGTVVAGGCKHALVAAFLAKHYGGHETPGVDVHDPVSTVTAADHHAVVSAGLINLHGSDRRMGDVEAPTSTVTAGGYHLADVRAFLVKYYGTDQDPRLEEPLATQTTKHRFGLVTVHGELYQIADIGMRMLTPRELYLAQGFPSSYEIEIEHEGKILSKTAQIRMCGNSVNPQVAAALVSANYVEPKIRRSDRTRTMGPLEGVVAA